MGLYSDAPEDTRAPPIRYLGYTPMVARILQPLFPCTMAGFFARTSHVRSFYVGMDAYQKAYHVVGKNKHEIPNKVIAVFDVLIWHGFASMFFPGAILYEAKCLMCKYIHVTCVPQLLTLALIPVIMPPIDAATQLLMNMTYRNYLGQTY